MAENHTWTQFWQWSDGPLKGYVTKLDDFERLRHEFEVSKSLSFVSRRKNSNFGSRNTIAKPYKIRHKDVTGTVPDGIPFIVQGTYERSCVFGPDKHKKDKMRRNEKRMELLQSDHPKPSRTRTLIQNTKKKHCQAKIIVKEVLCFPEFVISRNTERERRRISKIIEEGISSKSVKVDHRLYIRLPDDSEHNTHPISKLTGLMKPVDKSITQRIYDFVSQGVSSVSEMRRHLKSHIMSTHDSSNMPAPTDLAFFPTDDTIRKHIYLSQQKLRYSKIDQENLLHLISKWTEENADDKFDLIPATDPAPTDASELQNVIQEDEDEAWSTTETTRFFFCHQSKSQRHLLKRYGNGICLLDATYRTSKYALPLFFLAVKTNVGYSVVAEFVIQNETTAGIMQGLGTIKRWMTDAECFDWSPRFFMTDFCEREIVALEQTFPGTRVFLCDFHREQAWTRWLSKVHNGVSEEKEVVLDMLRKCAHAVSVNEYEQSVHNLQHSSQWLKYPRLRNWFTKTWLTEYKRWVWVYRLDGQPAITTNNGLERQNKVFKYRYLQQKKNSSLSEMITVLVREYLPAMMLKYIKENADCSEVGRVYSNCIPMYLHNRPRPFVRHCMGKIDLAEMISQSQIQEVGELFKVRSQSQPNDAYDINWKEPSCMCQDWKWNNMPCKHMFALIVNQICTWESLPEHYRNSPYITLDPQVSFLSCLTENKESGDSAMNAEIPSSSCRDEAIQKQSPQTKSVKQLSLLCREKLSVIRGNTYLCQDSEALDHLAHLLQEADTFLQSKLPVEDGLVTEPPQPVKSKSRRKKTLVPPKIDLRKQQEGNISHQTTDQKGGDEMDMKPDRNFLLTKAKELKNSMSEKEWKILIRKVNISRHLTLDVVSETAYAVMKHLDDDEQICVIRQLSSLAPRDMGQGGKFRLVNTILYELVQRGLVAAQYDVMKKRNDMATEMRRLVECFTAINEETKDKVSAHTENGKRKKQVRFHGVPPEKKSKFVKQDPRPYSGLTNPPRMNICFANAVLQCLRLTEIGQLIDLHSACGKSCFKCILRDFFTDAPVSCLSVCRELQNLWKHYRLGQQEDSHEFLTTVLDEIKPVCASSEDSNQLFSGSLKNTVTCSKCGSCSVSEEHFSLLSVAMKGVFDLNEALSKHFGTENINGFRCERCNTVTAATKGCQLTGLPKNFIISLKRFTRKRRKDTRHIKIPFELRLRPYIDRDLELEDKARLIGMVQHCGVSVTSGHYVAYVEVGMKWFRIDDMRISNITNNALSNEASSSYIYFYKTLPRPYIN